MGKVDKRTILKEDANGHNGVKYMDFTLDALLYDPDEVEEILEDLCESYIFQLESGEEVNQHGETYIHYQGRVKFKVKTRVNTVKNNNPLGTARWSPTCSVNTGNNFYVMKEETRIDGPWMDEVNLRDMEEEETPWDLEEDLPKPLKHWQQQVWDSAKKENRTRRHVDIVFDPIGNKGKSFIARRMQWLKVGTGIPPMNDIKDIMACIMDRPKTPVYIMDLPRGLNKEKLASTYASIEMLKGGDAYDVRYKFRAVQFNPPRIWVFTNFLPDMNLLSPDRWKVWRIENDVLVPLKENKVVVVKD